MVELEDELFTSIPVTRMAEAKGTRGVALSKDGGESFQSGSPEWKVSVRWRVLDPPVVQCGLLRADKGLIVFSD